MTETQLANCRQWIQRLHFSAKRVRRKLAFMEVCGTHTVNAFRSGLHSLMPDNVTLLSGPGCPVLPAVPAGRKRSAALGMRTTYTKRN